MKFFRSLWKREARPRRRFRAEPLAVAIPGEFLEQKKIDQALVFITRQSGKGLYLVKEPELGPAEQETYGRLMDSLWFGLKPVVAERVGDRMKYVEGFILDAASSLGIRDEVERKLQTYRYYIGKDGFGYGKLHVPMNDPEIEDISVVGYGRPAIILHRKYPEFGWLETNIIFHSEGEVRVLAQRLAQLGGKSITTALPRVDCSTTEGHRIQISLGGEVSFPGTSIDIRKFRTEPFSLPQLIEIGTLSPLMAAYFWLLVEHGGFTVVIGPPGGGKTTVMNCLLSLVHRSKKIGTAEDTLELSLPYHYWIRLKTREGYSLVETKYDISTFDLIQQLVRKRPDYIAVGEVRKREEAEGLLHAASIGLGCMATIHSDSPDETLTRLRALGVPEGGLMLIWCLTTSIFTVLPDGGFGRRIVDVSEVVPGVEVELQNVFRWDARSDSFSPDRAREVVERSPRLRVAESRSGMSRRELIGELEARADFLRMKVDEKKFSLREFVEEVARYRYEERR